MQHNRTAEDLKNISEETVISSLKYGQALAAWNCAFEGARGGMYRVSESTFQKDIQHILKEGLMKKRNREMTPESEIWDGGNCLCLRY